jgi:hypothetical protein
VKMTVTVENIRTTLLDSAYSTADISDATITEYIALINVEVSDAAIKHENIAGYELNVAIKDMAIKFGSCAMVLTELRNKGASQGLQAQRIAVSSETVQTFYIKYHDMLNNIRSGFVYGA